MIAARDRTVNSAAPSSALAAVGVRPRKSRGQNFLAQPRVAERIVAAADIAAGDRVVEIGPGLGILTEVILRGPVQTLALIELDARLAAMLKSRFTDDERVMIINRDFMAISESELGEPPLKMIGNLPFNAAGAILERLCEFRTVITRAVLMFQREVAERIRACPGAREYGALSVFTALYWQVREHFRVAAGSFHPKPKVDAEVLVMVPRVDNLFETIREPVVLDTVRAGFSAPRKTIRNSLAGGLGIETALAERLIVKAAIDPSARPGTLTTAEFVRIARTVACAGLLKGTVDA